MANTNSLPYGCVCLGDVVTEVYGMTWTEAVKLSKPERKEETWRTKRTQPGAIYDGISAHSPEAGHWARSRLHNGPG